MHCRRFIDRPRSRREMLATCASGFGAVALATLLADEGCATTTRPDAASEPLATQTPHFQPRATSVIFLYMDGGPSQVDTFDPKPRLDAEHGRPFAMQVDTKTLQFNNMGRTFGCPWKFRRYGQCGTPVSDLFPYVARHVDDMAVIRSMISAFPEHTNANYFLHTGHGVQGRPSMGSWITYGLGSHCRDLPGFIVLNGGLIPPGGLDCFNSGFLPATYQGSIFAASKSPVANVRPTEPRPELQRGKLDLLAELDQMRLEAVGTNDAMESAIANYELAFHMQAAVPDLMELSQESAATKRMYGLEADFENTRTFGRICLLARRLVERGVRFVELTCPSGNGDRWDQHSGLVDGHTKNARTVDQPIGALLTDLKQRGLLDSTLVIWGGEFGRTPFAQGSDGRDHNPFGFSMWLAGGGVQGGITYGQTDEYGYKVVDKPVEVHDLHATMLHLLGVDHWKQTYRFSGRDFRLTDVHGDVVHDVIA
jgi:hypothetical protein